MNAFLLSIGSELTTGQTVDTNAAWLSAELTRRGARVTGHLTIGDDVEAIREAVADALEASDLVITTGGLGPTPDDLTRQGLAAAIDRPLVEDAAAMRGLREMFRRWGRTMHPSNATQARVPEGCDIIPNPRGTAPGIRYRGEQVEVFALPGVPSEMRAMFEDAVLPLISGGLDEVRCVAQTIRCFGLSEAKVGELLVDLMARDRNPQVGTAAARAVITVRVVGRGRDEADAAGKVAADVAEVRRRLGDAVFGLGEDTLESRVAGILWDRGRSVAVAESCTGGWLAKRLTDLPGSSAYFLRGYVTYSNESKRDALGVDEDVIFSCGAVSEAVAREMASGCRTAAGADYALSITGIAGPTGGTPPDKPVGLVFIGLADGDGVEVRRILLGDHLSRGEIRDRACSAALNLLRLRLVRPDAL